jgi:hypothetical protein
VDIPPEDLTDEIADRIATIMISEVFLKVWSKDKGDFKDLSKKDLSREMFGAGAYLGIQAFMDSVQEMKKKKK